MSELYAQYVELTYPFVIISIIVLAIQFSSLGDRHNHWARKLKKHLEVDHE